MGGFGSKLWGSALHIPVMITLQLLFIILFGLFTRFDCSGYFLIWCFLCDCLLVAQYFLYLIVCAPFEIFFVCAPFKIFFVHKLLKIFFVRAPLRYFFALPEIAIKVLIDGQLRSNFIAHFPKLTWYVQILTPLSLYNSLTNMQSSWCAVVWFSIYSISLASIASPVSGSVSESAIDSFRFGDIYRIAELCVF